MVFVKNTKMCKNMKLWIFIQESPETPEAQYFFLFLQQKRFADSTLKGIELRISNTNLLFRRVKTNFWAQIISWKKNKEVRTPLPLFGAFESLSQPLKISLDSLEAGNWDARCYWGHWRSRWPPTWLISYTHIGHQVYQISSKSEIVTSRGWSNLTHMDCPYHIIHIRLH